jgi:hypothetical protein
MMSQATQTEPIQAAAGKTARVKATPAKANHLMRRVASYVLLAVVFFLLGFLPTWVESREASHQLSDAQHALTRAQMTNALGSAVINAQRGDYEPALESVSSFYTSLQAEIDSGEASVFSLTEQAAMQPLLGGRDALIALLAREDPAAAARLSDLYTSYGQILTGKTAVASGAGVMGSRQSALKEPTP